MIKITTEKGGGFNFWLSASYYKMKFPRETHVLAFKIFRRTLYIWYTNTSNK